MDPRPVPQHIETSTRGMEYLLAAMVPLVFVRPFFELAGFGLAIVVPLVYAKLTLGKPAGYLKHLLYSRGMPVPGLLDKRVRCFRR